MQQPTPGRIIHYFVNEKEAREVGTNGAVHLPAIVTQCFNGLNMVNASVFFPDEHRPVVPKFSLRHKSDPDRKDGESYWDWPEIKKENSEVATRSEGSLVAS